MPMRIDSSQEGGTRSGPRGLSRLFSPLLFLSFLFSIGGLLSNTTLAQVTSGSLTGIVNDPSGAVVPGARVVLTDANKGYNYTTITDAAGRYLVTNLLPSVYKITVEASGFKTFTQAGITLDVGARVAVDVRLTLGAATQSVEVSGAAPVLSTQDAVTGQEVDRGLINDLPLVDRSVLDLAFLAPGVLQVPGSTYGPNTGLNFVSNGGRNDTAEILVDGVAATSYEPNTAINTVLYQPSVDAVQEFKIMQNNYTAEEGFSGNTYINMVLRSGTNNLHGSVYDFLRNEKLDANNWFADQAGNKIPPLRRNQYGGTLGGPVKKDKTFFFFDWDGTREHFGSTAGAGVPSAAEKQGDFGEVCGYNGGKFDPNGQCFQVNPDGSWARDNDGNLLPGTQLWDPYSGVYVPGTGRVLQTFIPFNSLATFQSAGNPTLNGTPYQLAAATGNLIDPVALKMIQYYPAPNVNVGTASYDPYNNWSGSGINVNTNDQFDVRIDQRFTDKTAFNGRFSYAQGTYHGMNCFGNALDPCTQGPGVGGSRSIALSLIHTFSPTTLLNVSVGFTRGLSDTKGIAKDFPSFDPVKDLGLPAYVKSSGTIAAPVVYIYGGYRQAAGEALGAQAWSVYKNGNQVYHLVSTLTHMRGHHELKFGGEWRENQMNWYQVGVPGGVEIFDFNGTSQQPWSSGGDALASFLTGVGHPDTWGEYEISPHFSTQNYRWGGFVQDNWRARDKLTVNIGLRYDLEIPRTERHNRMSSFDPTLSLPIHPAAIDPSSWVYTNSAGNTVPMPFAIPDVTQP